jgi:alpha-glucosidase
MPAGWSPLAVAAQEGDPESMLSLYRAAIAVRRKHAGFAGDLSWLDGTPEGVLAFRREGGLVCVLNLRNRPVDLPPGEVLVTSVPLVDGQLPGDAAAWLA